MLFAYAWRSFLRRGTKSVLAVLGVTLAVALLVGVVSITRAVHAAVASSMEAVGADVVVQKRSVACPYAPVKLPRDLAPINENVVEQLKQVPGVVEASGVLEIWAFHGGHPVMIGGVDPAKKTLGPTRVESRDSSKSKTCCAIVAGRYLVPNDDYACIVSKPYADVSNPDIGKLPLLLGQKIFLGPDRRFEIVGVVDLGTTARMAGQEVFIPLKMAQQLLGKGPVVTTIFIATKNAAGADAVQKRATELIGTGTGITTDRNVDEGTAALGSMVQRSMLAVSVLIMIFVAAMLMRSGIESVMERITEIGLMKALGWRNSEVGRLFMIETLYSGVFGGVVGCVVGYLISYEFGAHAKLRLPDALSSYAPCSATPAPLGLPISTAPNLWLFGGGMAAALLIGTLAGMMASRRAARLDPAVALRRV